MARLMSLNYYSEYIFLICEYDRVAGGEKAMEKWLLVSHNWAAWASTAMGNKSNPLIDKVWNFVARSSIQNALTLAAQVVTS